MLNRVFVLDTNKQPLATCHPARAKELLKKCKAAVYRRFPFTIILKEAKPNAEPLSVTLKVDPGSKTTGIALVQDGKVIFAAELEHRGQAIKDALEKRRTIRRVDAIARRAIVSQDSITEPDPKVGWPRRSRVG